MMIDDSYRSEEMFAAPTAAMRERPYAAMRSDRDWSGWHVGQPAFATIEEIRHADELRLQLRVRLLRDAPPAPPWSIGVE